MRRLWIGVVATLAFAGAAVADRLSPPHVPLPPAVRAASPGGVWGCPVVKVPGTGGEMHLANTSSDPSVVRITLLPDGRKAVEQTIRLAGGTAASIGTPGSITPYGAGAVVEYAGGAVTVSRTLLLDGTGASGAGAAACSRTGDVTLVAPQGSTLKTETQLVVLNPGGSDAIVDIALHVGGRSVEPVSLHGRVVPARRRLVVREGDFVFDAKIVAATVTARAGRVVADAVIVAPKLLDVVPATPATTRVVTIASSARGAASFAAIGIGDADAVTDGKVLTLNGRITFQPLVTGIPADSPILAGPQVSDVPAGPIALVATSTTAAIATGARWSVSGGGSAETAMSSGVPPASSVVAVIGPPASSAALRLQVANPDETDARIDVTVITESGTITTPGLQHVALRGGFTLALSLRDVPAGATVGVVVSATGARIAAVLEAIAPLANRFCAYAVTALPVPTLPPVAVRPDARLGVPA